MPAKRIKLKNKDITREISNNIKYIIKITTRKIIREMADIIKGRIKKI